MPSDHASSSAISEAAPGRLNAWRNYVIKNGSLPKDAALALIDELAGVPMPRVGFPPGWEDWGSPEDAVYDRD